MSTTNYAGADTATASWNVCMSNDYCKYPVIVGFVVGGLVLITIIFCVARCLCCGGQCFGSCRRRKSKHAAGFGGFQPGPPPPVPYASQTQFQSSKQPMYAQSQQSPYSQTATFDAPAKSPVASTRYNEDSLPAMPSWNDAKVKHVEQEPVEMDRLHSMNETSALPQSHLLSGYDEPVPERTSGTIYAPSNIPSSNHAQSTYAQSNYAQSNYAQSNYAQSAQHYSRPGSQHDSQYGQAETQSHASTANAYMPTSPRGDEYEQYIGARSASAGRSPSAARSASTTRSPYVASQSPHPPRSPNPPRSSAGPSIRSTPSQSTAGQGSVLPLYSQPVSPSAASSHAASTVAPSYHTRAPSFSRSPPPQPPTEYGGYAPRRPLQGSWKDV